MASAKNKVLSGHYQNYFLGGNSKGAFIHYKQQIYFNKQTVSSYELLTEDKVKSGSSAIVRGALGAALLGPVGLLAGLSAKNKGIYLVAVEWKTGQKSLLEMDDKLYKYFLKGMF